MKGFFRFISVLILLVSVGCGIYYRYDDTYYGGVRPKRSLFRLKGTPLAQNVYQIIDTNAVYINSFYDSANEDTIVSAIRFFSNGKFYLSLVIGKSTGLIENQYNHVDSSGYIGYFAIDKDVVKAEVFLGRSYVTYEFNVLQNGLKEMSSKIRKVGIFGGAEVSSQNIYLKYYPVELRSKPNW